MKKENIICNPIMLNHFSDQELGTEEYESVNCHIRECSFCQKEIHKNQLLSSLFKTAFDRRYAKDKPLCLEADILEKIRKKKEPLQIKLRDFFVSRNFLIPAASLAAVMILFFTFIKFFPVPSAGPSAIITSLTGNISSVIIIETPESHQTVIWFDETL